MIVIAVEGASNTGKTTTIEYLISNLGKEGFKIGSIKHIHRPDFTIDTQGKDTWRYAQAGATVIMAIAAKETAIIRKTDAPYKDLDQIMGLLNTDELDIVFIEGMHELVAGRKDIPKIVASKNSEDLKKTLDLLSPPIIAITGLITQKKTKIHHSNIPLIDLQNEGKQLLEMVRQQIEHNKKKQFE